MRRLITVAAAGSICLPAAGCPTRDVSNLSPHNEPELVKEIPIDLNRDIDILFVIDNSVSMAQEQLSLEANFPRFINVLETIQGGLPNVNIAVVSSNVGISPYQTTGCSGSGDDGKFQNTPRGACVPPNGYFIKNWLADDGMSRVTNYPDTTSLGEVFSCIAHLGTTGCGLEQHLESMRRALDGHRPENANFLREDAYLAVIFVADEDDCSAKDGAVFDPSQTEISDPLGPFGSFRCTEFGIVCDGSPLSRSPATYADCQPMPAEESDYLFHPDVYVDFLEQLKVNRQNIIVAGILGNPAPVNVIYNDKGEPELDCSCGCETDQHAAPAVRLAWFLEQFPQRHTFTSICNQDLSSAMDQIAQLMKIVFGNPCLDGPVDLTDLDGNPANGIQLDCQVSDVVHKGTDQEQATVIPRCPMTGPSTPDTSTVPCWWVDEQPTICTMTQTRMLLHVERGGEEPDDTTIVARCVGEEQ